MSLPRSMAHSSLTADALLPEPLAAIDLKRLATAAMDAARSVGASYADIRVAERHDLTVMLPADAGVDDPGIVISSNFTYGVRALVDGVWSFQHGTVPSLDAVTNAARQAVSTARKYQGLTPRRVELAPTPSVTGSWSTPIQIDPFTVPIEEQYGLLIALTRITERMVGAMPSYQDFLKNPVGVKLSWSREGRTFASSEGSLTMQTLYRAEPDFVVGSYRGRPTGSLDTAWPTKIPCQAAGYETVLDPGLQDEIKALTQDVTFRANLPRRTIDVGRYPVVVDGETMGNLLIRSIGTALELDRVLGLDSSESGGTYLAPVEDTLGKPQYSPLLNVRGGRELPTLSAVQWDDEGVAPVTHQVIREGSVVDYHTSRETAPTLRSWYQQHGQPLRSYGCAVAEGADRPVIVRAPHLTMDTGKSAVPLDDLLRGMTRGILIRNTRSISMAQQMAAGSATWGAAVYEVVNGKVVHRLKNAGIQFTTRALWKALAALGDSSTVRTKYTASYKGEPWHRAALGATAPAGLFKDIDVVSTGLRW